MTAFPQPWLERFKANDVSVAVERARDNLTTEESRESPANFPELFNYVDYLINLA